MFIHIIKYYSISRLCIQGICTLPFLVEMTFINIGIKINNSYMYIHVHVLTYPQDFLNCTRDYVDHSYNR